MIIDFQNMEEKPMECFKGGVGVTNLKKFENELGKIILGRLEPGATIGLHTHETNSEAIYIVSGTADFIYDPDLAAGNGDVSAASFANTTSSPNADQNLSVASCTAAINADQILSVASCTGAINADQILSVASCTAAPVKYETVTAGGCHYCPKGHTHSMVNNSSEDIVFFAVIPEQ